MTISSDSELEKDEDHQEEIIEIEGSSLETISEEKQKFKKKKEEEKKVKELINYLDTKTELINTVVSAQKKMKKKNK